MSTQPRTPQVGEIYRLNDDLGNPFGGLDARVEEIRAGWIRYSRRVNFGPFSTDYCAFLPLERFLGVYTLAPVAVPRSSETRSSAAAPFGS